LRSWDPFGLGTEEGASEHDRPWIESYGSDVATEASTSVSSGRGERSRARPGRLVFDLAAIRAELALDLKSPAPRRAEFHANACSHQRRLPVRRTKAHHVQIPLNAQGEIVMTASTAGGTGRGIYGGTAPITIGSHVIDPITGKRGTVEQIIAPQKLVVRLEDGTLAQAEAPR